MAAVLPPSTFQPPGTEALISMPGLPLTASRKPPTRSVEW